jgi:hypothetical protein
MVNDDTVSIQYKVEEDHVDPNATVNVVIAAFTTCWARLHLLKYMEEVENEEPGRLLYFGKLQLLTLLFRSLQFLLFSDTDSIIFVSRPGLKDPETGNFLGQLTDELKPGQYITEFATLGPKSYAYQTNDGKTCTKMKGFTLNGMTSQQINLQSMLKMLFEKEVVTVPYTDIIRRNKRKVELDQIPVQNKRARFTYDKRVITDEFYNTKPFGTC